MFSGGSRPSAKEGARLTMNVEFCEDNSGTSKKMRYFRKNEVGARAPRVPPLDPATDVGTTTIPEGYSEMFNIGRLHPKTCPSLYTIFDRI